MAIGSAKDIRDDLAFGNLLKLNQTFQYFSPDDEFKEFAETVNLEVYGCFGCDKSFRDISRAQSHWKKNKKCHKPHTKKVLEELKRVEEYEKDTKGTEWKNELSERELSFILEKYRRWYYRILQVDIPYLQSLPCNLGKELPAKYKLYDFKSPRDFRTRLDMLEAYDIYTQQLHNLNIFIGKKFTFPLDWRLPYPWDFSESYESLGLLPVGESYDEYKKNRLDEGAKKQQQQDAILKEEAEQSIHRVAQKLEEEKKRILLQFEKKPAPELPTIVEEEPVVPVKVKRNSFTIPIPATGSLVNQQPILQFPVSISNTKVKRAPKTAPK